jgi:hypothetical protein
MVNGADLNNWKAGFGMNGGAQPTNGDADDDDDVDGADFLAWQRQQGFGATVTAAVASTAAAAPAASTRDASDGASSKAPISTPVEVPTDRTVHRPRAAALLAKHLRGKLDVLDAAFAHQQSHWRHDPKLNAGSQIVDPKVQHVASHLKLFDSLSGYLADRIGERV